MLQWMYLDSAVGLNKLFPLFKPPVDWQQGRARAHLLMLAC